MRCPIMQGLLIQMEVLGAAQENNPMHPPRMMPIDKWDAID